MSLAEEEERDSLGTMVWGAGAEASAAVCSELRAATWAYLEWGGQMYELRRGEIRRHG